MPNRIKFSGLLVGLLLTMLILAACGDSATSTPAAPTNTALPIATAASAPTAAPNVTSAATTVAQTTAATTLAATTGAATTAAQTTAAASGTPKKGGALTTATASDVKTLHPYQRQISLSYEYVLYWFNAKLTRRDPKSLQIVPLAASSWDVDKATNTVTFKLKPGIKWSDGQPITADDYAWTWQQAIKPENKWPGNSSDVVFNPKEPRDSAIEDYKAVDPQTLKIKLHGLVFNIVEQADVIEPLPKHIWEGKDWNDPTKNSEIDNPTVVSGPWKLKEWVRDNHLTVVRNDASTVWPVPYLDSITYSVIPNASVQFQKLKSGELDFLRPAEQDEPEAETLPNVTTYKWARYNSWDYIGINFRKPYLQDRALRQALMWTIDKKSLIDKVLFGLGAPTYSDVAPASALYNDKVEKYGYDPEKAKQILKDAGYKIENGKLIDPKGQPLPKMKFRHAAPNAAREKTAAVIQQEWKNLGIDLELVTSDAATFTSSLQKEPFDFDFWLSNWSPGYNPEDFGGIWLNIPTTNRGAWVNEDVNKLYAQARTELDFDKRKAIMGQIQEIESKELPYLYYYARVSYLSVNKKIEGVTLTPLGLITEDNNQAHEWYIK